jgi:hypothetical protein
MTFFELNEELKEKLVSDYGAFFARTTFFKEGVLLLPEPFYETIVVWHKETEPYLLEKAAALIGYYKQEIDENAEMTSILFEYNLGNPSLLWSIFPEKYPNYN